MKTAISIPDSLFAAAERVSHRLGISRSRFYAIAIERFLESDGRRGIKEALDAVYSRETSRLDSNVSKMQNASLDTQDQAW